METKKMEFAAISRGQKYSPNHIGNDAQIFNNTVHQLLLKGHTVNVYHEDCISIDTLKEDSIFTMIRGQQALTILQQVEDQGKLIINSTEGVLNCYRENLARILPDNNIPFPKSMVVDTNSIAFELDPTFNSQQLWVKRGDVHAIHREDVTLVYSTEELKGIIQEYSRRGIQKAVIQEHLVGDIVKFYAVNGASFFHWYYHPGSERLPFDPEYLREIAVKSAQKLKVDIYGGDAVIGADGSVKIIDLNDWPSYAPVRDVAAYHIANLIEKKALEHRQHSKLNKEVVA
jgi:glutathione synthase/RimK-type ligase-like ATP-grasp enzyme